MAREVVMFARTVLLGIGMFCFTAGASGQEKETAYFVLTPVQVYECSVDGFGDGECHVWSNRKTGSRFWVFCDAVDCFWLRTIHSDGSITETWLESTML